MTLNAVIVASAQRVGTEPAPRRATAHGGWFGAALLGALTLAAPAIAGDRAGIDYLGYSDDFRYFAFEEYGIQDGSGFAYTNIYVLDLSSDDWVKGAPIRVRIDDESVDLRQARAEAHAQAQPLLEQYGITEPVEILALNGDGTVDADFNRMTAGWPSYGMSAPAHVFDLTLESFTALGDGTCASYTDEPLTGFALTYTKDGTSTEVHRDVTVPKSRGCVSAYRLYGVIAPFDSFAAFNTDPTAGVVAIVSVYSLGFEGPDRRFIAVPLAH
ncbi:DUF2259 domain-containing protein [Devosia ginsengisoli]|uniref:DUF2259 domain-containing protein n=1 Tax=Devosia ginsengisoli TaxID=400770 RepID=UPI0026F1500F|nr:DUF2259 domain-containing protein [Devosia ginsengisoli]MCR6670908.1 DUF2259 domain-containing protein [Devosia ginsengisoli]